MGKVLHSIVCAAVLLSFVALSPVAEARSSSGGRSSSHSYSGSHRSDHYVHGYTRRDGTYVRPHYQTNPNSSRLDNYSTKGNVNPYTGKPGTVDPYTNSK